MGEQCPLQLANITISKTWARVIGASPGKATTHTTAKHVIEVAPKGRTEKGDAQASSPKSAEHPTKTKTQGAVGHTPTHTLKQSGQSR